MKISWTLVVNDISIQQENLKKNLPWTQIDFFFLPSSFLLSFFIYFLKKVTLWFWGFILLYFLNLILRYGEQGKFKVLSKLTL